MYTHARRGVLRAPGGARTLGHPDMATAAGNGLAGEHAPIVWLHFHYCCSYFYWPGEEIGPTVIVSSYASQQGEVCALKLAAAAAAAE